MHFGALMKARRRELGIRLPDLCKQTDINYPYLADVEAGNRIPTMKTVEAVCKVLKLNPNEALPSRTYMRMAKNTELLTDAQWTRIVEMPPRIDSYFAEVQKLDLRPNTLIEVFEDGSRMEWRHARSNDSQHLSSS